MFRGDVVLTDGVYDNLGLETAWKRYETVLVSDGGGSGWMGIYRSLAVSHI
jgi:hypothetical protein